ncbi:MAG: LysR family transcriptional regulator [Planctomycetes bacterium]|nr:LysR family transcriptional regulator [Planctomycetota bacterium]
MQLKSLKIFCDIVRRRSFSRAALDNGISQSSASQVVHHLEEDLGVQLLDRSKRPFVVTPEGERYYDGGLQLVSQYTQLEEEIRTLHDETARRLLVASIYSVGLAHMSAFKRQFSTKYPNAQVRLEYLHPDRVYEVVENGEVDFGLVSYPEQSRTLASTAWRNEPLVAVCHPEHRFASRPTLSLNDLAGESFVAFESDLRIRTEIDRALRAKKVEVRIAQEFDNVETMKRAIEANEGLSILPEPTLSRELASGTLARIPLKENLQRPLGIVYRRDREFGKIGQQFIQLLRTDTKFTGDGQKVEGKLR